jgi:hypothetical protein
MLFTKNVSSSNKEEWYVKEENTKKGSRPNNTNFF